MNQDFGDKQCICPYLEGVQVHSSLVNLSAPRHVEVLPAPVGQSPNYPRLLRLGTGKDPWEKQRRDQVLQKWCRTGTVQYRCSTVD
jgi:hypothetical protein